MDIYFILLLDEFVNFLFITIIAYYRFIPTAIVSDNNCD